MAPGDLETAARVGARPDSVDVVLAAPGLGGPTALVERLALLAAGFRPIGGEVLLFGGRR